MITKEQLEDWIAWSRQNIRGYIPIRHLTTDRYGIIVNRSPGSPAVVVKDPEAPPEQSQFPWEEELPQMATYYTGNRESLLTLFLGALNANPRDVPTRFTVLRICLELSLEDFRWLVTETVGIRDMPRDPYFIRWEIYNAYVAGEWLRAIQLCDRAETLDPQDVDCVAVRGVLRYFELLKGVATLTACFDFGMYYDFVWPHVWGVEMELPAESEQPLLADGLRGALSTELDSCRFFFPSPLTKIAADLGAALDSKPELSIAFRSVLAHCLFKLDKFEEAAAQYAAMRENLNDYHSTSYSQICLLLALSYERANQLEGARELYEELVYEREEESPEVLRGLARVYASLTKFDSAYRCLDKLAKLHPTEISIEARVAEALREIDPQPSVSAPVTLLHRIEMKLHEHVRRRLQAHFGAEEGSWWVKGVPLPIRQQCAQSREADLARRDPYAYTYLIDLKTIIEKNWALFEQDHARVRSSLPTKRDLLALVTRLNDVRNRHSHPTRAPRTDNEEFATDLAFISDAEQLLSDFSSSSL